MAAYQFVNPYNFIPLAKEKTAGENTDGTYTGMIQYSLLTKTPLFIPNTSNHKAFKAKSENANSEHKSYDFFSYADISDHKKTYENEYHMPVIPGSEVRGMFRNHYEILTNSCMSAIDDEVTLSKRTAEVYKPGLLKKNENGKYSLYKAEDCLWRTKGTDNSEDEARWRDNYYVRKCYIQSEFPEGRKVSFRYEKRTSGKALAKKVSLFSDSSLDGSGFDTGYIIKGEKGPETGNKGEKHCCHIFKQVVDKKKQKEVLVSENITLETLDAVLKEYKDNEKRRKEEEGYEEKPDTAESNKKYRYQEYREQLEKFKNGTLEQEYFPVYYSKYSELCDYIMLSPASITREIYQNRLKDLIGTFTSCKDAKSLCPACSLFGTLGDGFAKTSRIRFSDLICEENRNAESCYNQIVTLPPLSSPKLNNMEFYLKQPNADAWFWTYDYYVDSKGKVYPCTPSINGRKFYWHQMNATLPESVEETKLNMTIRPVKAKVTFKGKLYFEHLTEKELNQLIWLLNAGEDQNTPLENRKHGYKIGAAKPLGLGSAAIAVEQVLLRKVTMDTEKYSIVRSETPYTFDSGKVGFNPEIEKNFMKMTDFNAVQGKNVSYPTLKSTGSLAVEKGYEWFTANHKGYNHKKAFYTNMPNTRSDMYYEKCMEAMNPDLKFISSFIEPRCAIVTGKDRWENVYIKVEGGKTGKIWKNQKNENQLNGLNKGNSVMVKLSKIRTLEDGTEQYMYELTD